MFTASVRCCCNAEIVDSIVSFVGIFPCGRWKQSVLLHVVFRTRWPGVDHRRRRFSDQWWRRTFTLSLRVVFSHAEHSGGFLPSGNGSSSCLGSSSSSSDATPGPPMLSGRASVQPSTRTSSAIPVCHRRYLILQLERPLSSTLSFSTAAPLPSSASRSPNV